MKITDILNIEQANTRHIHLYHYKDKAWRCCGRSAELLYRFYPNIPCREHSIHDTGIQLPSMIIDHMTLRHLIEQIPPIEQTQTHIVFKLPEALRHFYDT